MNLGGDQSNWYSVRFTEVPSSAETVYIYTVQSVQDDISHWLDIMVEKRPELL
jgi:hypothetical protein